MRHHNKIILAERRKKLQWHKMKRAGKKTFATFLPPPSLSPFCPSFCPFFSGTLWGGGGSSPQAPHPWVRSCSEHVQYSNGQPKGQNNKRKEFLTKDVVQIKLKNATNKVQIKQKNTTTINERILKRSKQKSKRQIGPNT